MTYVALLRGINVGGNNKVEMARLKTLFEGLGFEKVKTFIASGNVIFTSPSKNRGVLTTKIEAAIHAHFKFPVRVLLKNKSDIVRIAKAIPKTWVTSKEMKCDVMLLWDEIDHKDILKQLPSNKDIEDVKYVPGAVLWRLDRENATKTRMTKIIGTKLYKRITIRNANSVRKIRELMEAA